MAYKKIKVSESDFNNLNSGQHMVIGGKYTAGAWYIISHKNTSVYAKCTSWFDNKSSFLRAVYVK